MSGDADKLAQLEAMAQADPDDALTFFLLGGEQLRAERYPEAAESFRRCLTLNPDHTAAMRLLGDACRLAGDREEAMKVYREAIELADRTGDLQVAKEAKVFLKRLESEG